MKGIVFRIIPLLAIALGAALLVVPSAAFAGTGPNPKYAEICLYTTADNWTGDYTLIYSSGSGSQGKGALDTTGFSYDKATNTLTMNGVDGAGKWLSIQSMGEDFKIAVVGANVLDKIEHMGAGWGGSIAFTGTGSIALGNGGIRASGGAQENPSNTVVTIGAGVTFTAQRENGAAVNVASTTADPGIVAKGSLGSATVKATPVLKRVSVTNTSSSTPYTTTFDGLYVKGSTFYGLDISYSSHKYEVDGPWIETTRYKLYRLEGDEASGFTYKNDYLVWEREFTSDETPAVPTGYDPQLAGCTDYVIADAEGKALSTVELGASVVRPAITTKSLPVGKVGVAYSATVAAEPAAGGTITSFSLGGTASGWATISADGKIAGTPAASGTYTAVVTATETVGGERMTSLSKSFTITVGAQAATLEFTEPLDDGCMHSVVVSSAGTTANYLRSYSLGAKAIEAGQAISIGALEAGDYEIELTSTAVGNTVHFAKKAFTVETGKDITVTYAPVSAGVIAESTAVAVVISNYPEVQESGMRLDLQISGPSGVERIVRSARAMNFVPSVLSGEGDAYEVTAVSYDALGNAVDVTGAISKNANTATLAVDTGKLASYTLSVVAADKQMPSDCVTLAQGGSALSRIADKYWLTNTDGLVVASADLDKLVASACDVDNPSIEVAGGVITVTYPQLQTAARIGGTVRYGAAADATPAVGVDVVASQLVGDCNHVLSSTTDENGAYTLGVYPDAPVTLNVVSTDGGKLSSDYAIDALGENASWTADLVADRQYAAIKLDVACEDADRALVTKYLAALDGAVLKLSLGEGEGAFGTDLAIASKWDSSLTWSNAAYVVRQGGSDTYTATVTGGGLSASQSCTLDAGHSSFAVTATPTAGVAGHVTGSDPKASFALAWYDGDGRFRGCSKSYSVSSEGVDVAAPNPDGDVSGSYTVALVPAAFIGALGQYTLAEAIDLGVVATSWQVSVAPGAVTELADATVSEAASADAAYVTKPNSTLLASQTSFTDTTDIITYSGVIALDDNLSGGKLQILEINAKDPMVGGYENSVTILAFSINGETRPVLNMNSTGSYVTESLLDIPLPCEYTIYASPQSTSRDACLSLSASGIYDGGNFDWHLIGSSRIERPGASLQTLSDYVNRPDVLVSGTALPGESVKICDSGSFVGTAFADKAGVWNALVPLAGTDATLSSVHELRAVTASGAVSKDLQVIHDPAGPQLTSLVMRFTGGYGDTETVESGGSYVYRGTMDDVEFAAEFDNVGRLGELPDFSCTAVFKVMFVDGTVKYLKATPAEDGATFTARLDYSDGKRYPSIVNFQCLYQPVTSSVGFDAEANALTLGSEDGAEIQAIADFAKEWKETGAVLDDSDNWGVTFNEKTGKYETTGSMSTASGGSLVAASLSEGAGGTLSAQGDGLGWAADQIDLDAFSKYASAFSEAGLRLENASFDYEDTVGTLAWFQACGDDHVQNHRLGVGGIAYKGGAYWRSVAYASRADFEAAKADVAGVAGGHETITVDDKPYDRYVLTDARNNADGALEGGTFFTSVTYYVDDEDGVYAEVDEMILGSTFRGFSESTKFKGLLSVQAQSGSSGTVETMDAEYDEWENNYDFLDHVPSFYEGNFTGGLHAESTNAEFDTAMEQANEGMSAMNVLDKMKTLGGAPQDVKPSGGSSISGYANSFKSGLGLNKIEQDMGYRTSALERMDFDIDQLMRTSCYDKLSDVQKAAVQDSVNNFKKWRKTADGYNFWTSLANYELTCAGIGAALTPGGAAAGTVTGSTGKVSGKVTDKMIGSTFGSAVVAYRDAYSTIVKVIRSRAEQKDDPLCKAPGQKDGGGGAVLTGNDPSGIVYEGVIENPVAGATAALYYAADDAGRMVNEDLAATATHLVAAHGVGKLLPSEAVQMTGADGRFEWGTPRGLWYVEVSSGALVGDSGSDRAATVTCTIDGKPVRLLPVLPVQLDVNIPLVDASAPFVEAVSFTDKGLLVTFSKYMADTGADESVLAKANYALKDASGAPVAVKEVRAVDQGHTPANIDGDDVKTYTRQVLVVPQEPAVLADNMTLTVASTVQSYAGTSMGVAFELSAGGEAARPPLEPASASAKITSVTLEKAKAAYTGKAIKPAVKEAKAGTRTLGASDYTVSYKNSKGKAIKASAIKDAGTYKVVVTAKAGSGFTGSKTLDFKVTKAKNEVKAGAESVKKTLKAKALKKKAAAVKLPKASATFGKATWKVRAKDKRKVLSLDAKTGKVKVRKGAKKGTYTLVLKAEVAGTKNYKAATTKDVTVKVEVK